VGDRSLDEPPHTADSPPAPSTNSDHAAIDSSDIAVPTPVQGYEAGNPAAEMTSNYKASEDLHVEAAKAKIKV